MSRLPHWCINVQDVLLILSESWHDVIALPVIWNSGGIPRCVPAKTGSALKGRNGRASRDKAELLQCRKLVREDKGIRGGGDAVADTS